MSDFWKKGKNSQKKVPKKAQEEAKSKNNHDNSSFSITASNTANSSISFTNDCQKINSNSQSISVGSAKKSSDRKKNDSGILDFLPSLDMSDILNKSIAALESIVQRCNELSTAAKNIRVTCEQLQGLEYAAKAADISVETIPDMFNRIHDAAQKALGGDSEAIKSFGQLGINIDELKDKKPYELFELIAQSIKMIDDPIERSQAGVSLFGEEFNKMQGFIDGYTDSIKKAKENKTIIDEEQIQAALEFSESLSLLKIQLAALVVNSGLLEGLQKAVELMNKLASNDRVANVKRSGKEKFFDKAIENAEKSGQYTPAQIKSMKSNLHLYQKGTKSSMFAASGNDQNVENAYNNIDHALHQFGAGAYARQNVNGKKMFRTEVEEQNEAQKFVQEKTKRKVNRETFSQKNAPLSSIIKKTNETEKKSLEEKAQKTQTNANPEKNAPEKKPESLPGKETNASVPRLSANHLKDAVPIGSPSVDRVLGNEKIRELVQKEKMEKFSREYESFLSGKNSPSANPKMDARIREEIEACRKGKTIRFSREEQDYLNSDAFNSSMKPDMGRKINLIQRPDNFAGTDIPPRLANFKALRNLEALGFPNEISSSKRLEDSVRNIEAILKIGLPDQTM